MASAGGEWLKQDKRRMLHAVYRVGDMQVRRAVVPLHLHTQRRSAAAARSLP